MTSNTYSPSAPSTGLGGFGKAPGDGFAGAISRFARKAASAVSGRVQAFRRSREIKRTYNELSALDDRILRDIGVSRSDLAAVAIQCVDHPEVDCRKSAR